MSKLDKSNDSNDSHPLNILTVFSIEDFFKLCESNDSNDTQSKNIFSTVFTFDISKLFPIITVFNILQLSNISFIDVTFEALNFDKLTSIILFKFWNILLQFSNSVFHTIFIIL